MSIDSRTAWEDGGVLILDEGQVTDSSVGGGMATIAETRCGVCRLNRCTTLTEFHYIEVMWILTLVLALVAFASGLGALRAGQSRSRLVFLTVTAGSAIGATVSARYLGPPESVDDVTMQDIRPIEVAGADDPYVSSEACRECHADQHRSWHASYHRTMTQLASPESVLGDFRQVETEAYGHFVRLDQQDDEFWVTMHDPEQPVTPTSPLIRRPVVMTTGSHHMQVYWYATGKDRRLGQLPLVWLCDDARWIPLHSIFIRPPQTEAGKNEARWNNTCIKCHTTQGRPRIDLAKRHVDTHVAEFGIACEACHGPGREHVASHRSQGKIPPVRMIHPGELDHQRSADVCGQCHGVWMVSTRTQADEMLKEGLAYRPGQKLSATRHLFNSQQKLTPHVAAHLQSDPDFIRDRFWSDGMVRISGREYNGLIRSPCFQSGTMSCVSCHELHPDASRINDDWTNDQLSAAGMGNETCTQCHQAYRDSTRLVEHTHHAASSTGSSCVNCHMPYTTYGLLKAIRSHQISSPTASETVSTGRPNACNLCHIDQTLPWTASHLEKWFGTEVPAFSDTQTAYSAVLLDAIQGDAGQRALAAATLGWEPAIQASRDDWVVPILGQLLLDPYDAVRYVAYRSLKRHSGFEDFPFDFMGDPQHRFDQSRAAYSAWKQTASARHASRKLLVSETGDFLHVECESLLRGRDNRVVVLAE